MAPVRLLWNARRPLIPGVQLSLNPLDGAHSNVEIGGYLAHSSVALLQSLPDSGFDSCIYLRPAQYFAFVPGPRKASTDTFLDHGTLEFREHAHHLKHRLADRGRG